MIGNEPLWEIIKMGSRYDRGWWVSCGLNEGRTLEIFLCRYCTILAQGDMVYTIAKSWYTFSDFFNSSKPMKPKRRLPNWTNTFFEFSVISKFKVFSSCFQSSNCTTFHTENSTNRGPKILLKDAPLLHFPFRSYLHVVVTPTFKSTPVLYSVQFLSYSILLFSY